MPVLIDGSRHRKAVVVQGTHKRYFFEGGQAAEVEPVAVRAVLVVVAQILDVPEAGTTEAIELESHLIAIGILGKEYITLLTNSYLRRSNYTVDGTVIMRHT